MIRIIFPLNYYSLLRTTESLVAVILISLCFTYTCLSFPHLPSSFNDNWSHSLLLIQTTLKKVHVQCRKMKYIYKICVSQKKEDKIYNLYHLMDTIPFSGMLSYRILINMYISHIKYKVNYIELFYLCLNTTFYVRKYASNIQCLKHISLYGQAIIYSINLLLKIPSSVFIYFQSLF